MKTYTWSICTSAHKYSVFSAPDAHMHTSLSYTSMRETQRDWLGRVGGGGEEGGGKLGERHGMDGGAGVTTWGKPKVLQIRVP